MTCKIDKICTQYSRRYTKFFGCHETAGPSLVCHALRSFPDWETKIDEWQQPILQDKYVY